VEPGAIRKYSQKIACAVTLLVQNHTDPSPEHEFPINHAVSLACKELADAFKEAKQSDLQAGNQSAEEEEDGSNPPPDEEEFIVHSDNHRDANDPDPGPLPDSPEPHPSTKTKGNLVDLCPVIQPKLHSLLFEIYRDLPSAENPGQFYSVLMRYLLLSSIRNNGEWKPSGVITQYLSALLFGARIVMFAHMHRSMEGSPDRTYHRYRRLHRRVLAVLNIFSTANSLKSKNTSRNRLRVSYQQCICSSVA
jgi:hypothetical protein